ncbi:RNA polymerase sigma-70 factor [Pseudoflavitalea rhizosphaerae]|uniref:RNA polymerase sigma-70 factor n=1 Tax=Pseudoflavitalea rhizosphaerae TaxID=1884793 RepID=UPI0013DFC102|nr:RNA polymerase sigma-70 factor [Pseudoflavitalea rhizosphaerae]
MKEQFPEHSGYPYQPEPTTVSETVTSPYRPAPDQDQAMVEELRNGNSQAMISFFNLYYAPLCYFAERMIHDRQAAEDIVEDTFMKLWKKHTDFASIQNIKAFLYITTRNACLNLLKQYQRDAVSRKELAYLNGDSDDFVLNSIIRTEVMAEIYRQIEKLPTQSRKVLKMSVFENMRNHEIAAALDVSIHTVKNQKVRAMQLLRMNICRNRSGT